MWCLVKILQAEGANIIGKEEVILPPSETYPKGCRNLAHVAL